MSNKPFGKEPFAWKHDPQYQQQKLEKLEKLHEKVLQDELSQSNKDKYGNIIHKQLNMLKQPNEELVESKKQRFKQIASEALEEQSKERHPYELLSMFQRCGNSVVEGDAKRMSVGSGDASRQKRPAPDYPYKKTPSMNEVGKPPEREPEVTIKNKQGSLPQRGTSIRKDKVVSPPTNPIPKVPSHKKGSKPVQKKQSEFMYERYGGERGPDAHLIDMLEKEVICTDMNVKLEDIADLEVAKNLLQEAVLLPLLIPSYFKGIRRPWRGVLMFGPPGTGKTLLAKAIASTGKTKFFNISASSLASKWRGESEKLVRLLFEMARYYAPSTIFVDEIDSVASKRSDGDDEASRKVKTQFLTQMDGVGSSSDKPVIVIAATNRPWDLDEALRRRLEKRIYVPLPTEKGRRQLFELNTKNLKLDSTVNFDALAKQTKGYSGADIVVLIRSASFLPLRRYFKKKGQSGYKNIEVEDCQREVDIPLTQQDFLEAFKTSNPSVGTADLSNYDKWMKQFGSV